MKMPISIFCLLLVGCTSKMQLQKVVKCQTVQDGICFNTYTHVDLRAVERARYIIRQMLKNSPEIKKKMSKNNFVIDIIGLNQNLSDLPRYHFLKNQKTFDGRLYDHGTRGVGDKEATSVGEENLLCFSQQKFWQENILVHEFAHSIRYFMGEELSKKIDEAYLEAKKKKLYPKDIYMMANSQEYWAEATQAWFNATTRHDVNGGINSRVAITKHDPKISAILKLIYGTVEIERSINCPY